MNQLRPFAPTPAAAAFKILSDLEFRADALEITYHVQGPIDDLVLPLPLAKPDFRDELWTTTCLELFLQEEGQSAYEEWNFSPSGNWAYYHFQSYRQASGGSLCMQPLEPLHCFWNDHQLLLKVSIPMYQTFVAERRDLRYGLTAVLQLKSGEKQYWALAHAGDKPDFHLAESFQGKGRPG